MICRCCPFNSPSLRSSSILLINHPEHHSAVLPAPEKGLIFFRHIDSIYNTEQNRYRNNPNQYFESIEKDRQIKDSKSCDHGCPPQNVNTHLQIIRSVFKSFVFFDQFLQLFVVRLQFLVGTVPSGEFHSGVFSFSLFFYSSAKARSFALPTTESVRNICIHFSSCAEFSEVVTEGESTHPKTASGESDQGRGGFTAS